MDDCPSRKGNSFGLVRAPFCLANTHRLWNFLHSHRPQIPNRRRLPATPSGGHEHPSLKALARSRARANALSSRSAANASANVIGSKCVWRSLWTNSSSTSAPHAGQRKRSISSSNAVQISSSGPPTASSSPAGTARSLPQAPQQQTRWRPSSANSWAVRGQRFFTACPKREHTAAKTTCQAKEGR